MNSNENDQQTIKTDNNIKNDSDRQHEIELEIEDLKKKIKKAENKHINKEYAVKILQGLQFIKKNSLITIVLSILILLCFLLTTVTYCFNFLFQSSPQELISIILSEDPLDSSSIKASKKLISIGKPSITFLKQEIEKLDHIYSRVKHEGGMIAMHLGRDSFEAQKARERALLIHNQRRVLYDILDKINSEK